MNLKDVSFTMEVPLNPNVFALYNMLREEERTIMACYNETNSDTVHIDAAVAAVVTERRRQAEITRRTKLVDSLGDDNFDTGQIIRFKKQFSKKGTAYTYAAVKRADGRWSTSSSHHPTSLSWDELIVFIVSGQVPTETYDIIDTWITVGEVDTKEDTR